MRSYYKILECLREILEDNEDVNTIIHAARSQGDLFKKNIYPLVVINPTGGSLDNGNVNSFDFEIAAMDQRDLSNAAIVDKFVSNDNEIDNLNLCHSILNKLITKLRLQNNEDEIDLVSVSNVTPIIFDDKNILDGWIMSITISVYLVLKAA